MLCQPPLGWSCPGPTCCCQPVKVHVSLQAAITQHTAGLSSTAQQLCQGPILRLSLGQLLRLQHTTQQHTL